MDTLADLCLAMTCGNFGDTIRVEKCVVTQEERDPSDRCEFFRAEHSACVLCACMQCHFEGFERLLREHRVLFRYSSLVSRISHLYAFKVLREKAWLVVYHLKVLQGRNIFLPHVDQKVE